MCELKKTLVLGLGNPILADDGVGIEVAHRIRDRLNGCHDIDVTEASVGGLGLLDSIVGYDKLIVIDSIKTENGIPGTLYRLRLDDLRNTIHISSPHDTNFATAIEFGKRCGLAVPEQVDIYAIEVEDNATFSEQLTPPVRAAIPRIVDVIVSENSLGANARSEN